MKLILSSLIILFNCLCTCFAQKKNEFLLPEMVYVHTDRNIYLAGDYLYYSLYLQGNPGKVSRYAYLVLRSRNNSPIARVRLEINNQKAFGRIFLSDTLHTDIYQLICYTNCMRNKAEGSFFNKEIVIVNHFDKVLNLYDSTIINKSSFSSPDRNFIERTDQENISISLENKEYSPREKVTFYIETKDCPGNVITRLSVSVTEIVPEIPADPDISDYFSKTSNSEDSGEQKQNQCSFYPEIKRSVIQGRIIPAQQPVMNSIIQNKDDIPGIKNQTVLLSSPDSIANFQYTTTDSLGLFRFLLNPYYEGKELIIRLKENVSAVIELDNKFKLIQPYTPSGQFNLRGIRTYLIRSLNIFEIQKFYVFKSTINFENEIEENKIIPRVYYKPFTTIFPDDYLELPDFVEISREILPFFKVRRNNDSYFLSITDIRDKGFFNSEPMIFMDGVPIDDVNQIINLGTKNIKRIEALPVNRYHGAMSLPGILAIFSKNLEINNIKFKTPVIRYQPSASQICTKPEPYYPVVRNKHIPDLRQVLLWDPEIILRNNEKKPLEFYTSDLQGDYRISIQGITSDGFPVSVSAVFTVKFKSN
jgi:hypothetical protein